MKTENEVTAEIQALKKLLRDPATREDEKLFIRSMIASLQWVIGDASDVLTRLWTVSQAKKSDDKPN